VKSANWLNHLEFDWQSPVWRHLLHALARHHQLIRYDERGNGLSDWSAQNLSFEAFLDDLETVVDAAGLDRFPLFGISQGCAVSIAYAVRHPQRVTRLILAGGYARGWRKRGSADEIARREALQTLTLQGWGQENPAYRQIFTSLYLPDATPEQANWWNELQRITTSPQNAYRLSETLSHIDVRHLLEKVKVPTLVLHSRDDAVVPFECGRELASGIRGARFVPLDSRNHIILEHEPAWPRFLSEISAFLPACPNP
jgi:pimeloyl-ACP methyl ester carboxylesterase